MPPPGQPSSTAALRERVAAAVREADPVGLLAMGAPEDEYEPEVRTIVPQLMKVRSFEGVRALVHTEFVEWFDAELAGPIERYDAPARAIWAWMELDRATLDAENARRRPGEPLCGYRELGRPCKGVLRTARLELVQATFGLLRAARCDRDVFADALGAVVPPAWPPEFLDDAALAYAMDRVCADPEQRAWWMYLVVLADGCERPTLIGSCGYKGPPDANGTVEIGYGIVSDRRRRGYATEVARGLAARAFADARVNRVIAETLPELAGSIGVLARCGFRRVEGGSEPGVIRFELARAEHERGEVR